MSRGVVAAELVKIRTLPTAVLTMVGTVAAGGVLGAAAAGSGDGAVGAVEAVLAAVPFVQAGMVLLGLLPVAHEYAGNQIRTSLVAVPDRWVLVAGKGVAALLVSAMTSVVATVVTLLAAVLVRAGVAGAGLDGAGLGAVAGAAGYLTVVAMLAFALALLLRHLVPALVSTLALVLIVSPVAASQTEHARWLPDRAAQQLYAANDTVLTPVTGGLVALAWMAAIGLLAAARFVTRDA